MARAWSGYNGFEGPAYFGGVPFKLPAKPTEADRILAVITATEGGRWNAVNMYDRCILTVGLIQWCEASQCSVSNMLGVVAEHDARLLAPMNSILARSASRFEHTGNAWRFITPKGIANTIPVQQRLFLLNSSGKKGSWDAESRVHANAWCDAMVAIFANEDAIRCQRDYTAPKLGNFFVMPAVRGIFNGAPSTPLGRAFKAAFLSFAANNSLHAARALESVDRAESERYSIEWLVAVLEAMTFNPGITIYPGRYNKIRPVLEKLYGIDIPDLSTDLRSKNWLDTEQVQESLIALGYDLGETGADGNWGRMSRAAMTQFQADHNLIVSGFPSPRGNEALVEVLAAKRKLSEGTSDDEIRAAAKVALTKALSSWRL